MSPDARRVELLETDLDDPRIIQELREAFAIARASVEYRAAFRASSPLVTVCITTSDRGSLLAERALLSMRKQTYKNLQVIVAGDQCEDDTYERIASLNDDRFQFINLPERGPYPRPGHIRRLVAGTYPGNAALRLTEGEFVTHIDEDDTFDEQRIATLIAAIQAHEADVVFHPFSWEEEDGSWKTRGNGVFELGQTGTSMVLYHKWLARIPWDINAYRLGEPGDWNRFRKFQALGVRTLYVPQVLTSHFRFPKRGPFVPKPGERFLE